VPPRAPARQLIAFAELFGVNPGTARVALSRMVERGELRNDDGVYHLTGDLLARQQRQTAGLEPNTGEWDHTWELWVVDGGGRAGRDRAALRRAAAHLSLFERREGVWLRPANLHPDRLPAARAVLDAQADRYTARPDHDPAELIAELVDLDGWARAATELEARIADATRALAHDAAGALADGFVVAAATLRHLVSDPRVPATIAPRGWPAATLRARYADYDRTYRAELRTFLRSR